MSVEYKQIETNCTGESLPTWWSIRWSYLGRTLNMLVSNFNQYNPYFEEAYTKSKAKNFKILLGGFYLIRFLQPIFL